MKAHFPLSYSLLQEIRDLFHFRSLPIFLLEQGLDSGLGEKAYSLEDSKKLFPALYKGDFADRLDSLFSGEEELPEGEGLYVSFPGLTFSGLVSNQTLTPLFKEPSENLTEGEASLENEDSGLYERLVLRDSVEVYLPLHFMELSVRSSSVTSKELLKNYKKSLKGKLQELEGRPREQEGHTLPNVLEAYSGKERECLLLGT